MLRGRHIERQQATTPGSGGGSTAPAAAPSILDDVKTAIADIEKADGGGQASAPEHPAPAAPAAPAAAAPAAPPKPASSAAPAAPSTPPPQKFYTDEELGAFEGEYDRRDFDWNRVDPALRPRLRVLESGTGKYRSRLEQRIRSEIERGQGNNQPPAAKPSGNEPAFNAGEALEEFLNPVTMFTGLRKILATDDGKKVLGELGYSDPTERAVVSELVQDRVIQTGLIGAQEMFPQLTKDDVFLGEVREIIANSPAALKALQSRNPEEAEGAFLVASAHVIAKRQAAQSQAFTDRERTLSDRENAIKAKEADLQKQIEASNRTETVQTAASVGGGGQQSAAKKETSLLDDVRELGPKFGMFTQ